MKKRFTLIEMIVALSLLVLVASVLLFGTNTVVQSWERLESHTDAQEEIVRLDQTLSSMMRNVVPFSWPTEGEEKPWFQAGRQRIRFCYRHRLTNVGRLRFCEFSQKEGKLIVRYADRPEKEFGQESILARNVEDVSFRFADLSDGLTYEEEWRDDSGLPAAIMIIVRWQDGRQESWLYRIAGASRYEQLWAAKEGRK